MNPPDALSATASDRTIAYTEQAFTFAVGADRLVGILHAPRATTAATPMQRQVARASDTGVVVIVGGPQYRVGIHRQFVRLARHLAALGHPVLRFDARGMGDSSGALHSFEHTSDDIAAAIDELMTRQPQVRRVVLWGLCDGAAAALLYLHGRADPRVQALCLLNPWVRSEASLARTQIKHYYGQRLLQRTFWLKLLSGQVAGAALRGLWTSLRAARAGLGRDAAAEPFPVRMAQAWQRFGGDILLVLSGKDYTAREFQDVVAAHPAWKGALDRPNVQLLAPEAADHTFSDRAQSRQLELAIGDWLTSCAKAADHVACRPADRPTLPQPPMPDRPNLVTSLRLSCLEIGVFATLTNALDRALRAVSGGRARLVSYALVAQPIGHPTSAPLRPSASSRIVEVGRSDPLVQSMPRPKGVLDRRFAARF